MMFPEESRPARFWILVLLVLLLAALASVYVLDPGLLAPLLKLLEWGVNRPSSS